RPAIHVCAVGRKEAVDGGTKPRHDVRGAGEAFISSADIRETLWPSPRSAKPEHPNALRRAVRSTGATIVMVGEGAPSSSAQWNARKPWMAGPSPAMTFVAPVSRSFRRLISVKPYGLRHARRRQ